MFYSKILISILNFLDFFQKKKILSLINNKFSEPIVIFDVGAHYGESIKMFLKKFSIEKIYSFEASPQNFKKLKKKIYNIRSNKIEIYNFALGENNSNNFINQTIESSSSTINELNKNSKYFEKKLKILNVKNKEYFYDKLPIKIITLDYFIEKNNIHNVDLIKIDTEGYEYYIIKGLLKYSPRVKLIYFEHHYDDMIIKNYKFSDIHQLLTQKGFKMIKKSKMLFRKSFEYVYENIEIIT